MNINTICKLHTVDRLFYIAATGGGTSFTGQFLSVPGGSKIIVGGVIPYDSDAFIDFAGKVDKFADDNAARKLALASYEYCLKIQKPSNRSVGVGIACSLATNNERINRIHKINIAIQELQFTCVLIVNIQQGMTREQEETLTNDLTLELLECVYLKNLNFIEVARFFRNKNTEKLTFFLDYGFNLLNPTESIYTKYNNYYVNSDTLVVYPGSFSILHSGHIEIPQIAKEITGFPVYYELTIKNSYKAMIDFIELSKRISQFDKLEKCDGYMVTTAPRFVDKFNVLKNHIKFKELIFVVGADIWERVYDKAAHDNGDIKFFEDNNIKFLVFGRDAEIKNQDSKLFIRNERAQNYNNPISSTKLKNKEI